MNHVTIGVYSNGDFKVNVVHPNDLQSHIEYNKIMRFGRALFVDGECVNQGYLSNQDIEAWKEKIKDFKIDSSKVSDKYH